jgi:hypothetical protein
MAKKYAFVEKIFTTIPVFIRSKELLVPMLEDMTPQDWDAFIKQLQYKRG